MAPTGGPGCRRPQPPRTVPGPVRPETRTRKAHRGTVAIRHSTGLAGTRPATDHGPGTAGPCQPAPARARRAGTACATRPEGGASPTAGIRVTLTRSSPGPAPELQPGPSPGFQAQRPCARASVPAPPARSDSERPAGLAVGCRALQGWAAATRGTGTRRRAASAGPLAHHPRSRPPRPAVPRPPGPGPGDSVASGPPAPRLRRRRRVSG